MGRLTYHYRSYSSTKRMQGNAAHRCVLQTNVLSPQRTSLVSGLPRLEVDDDPSSPLNSDPSSSRALSSSLLSSRTLTRASYPLSRVVQDYLLNHYPSSTRHCISNILLGSEPHTHYHESFAPIQTVHYSPSQDSLQLCTFTLQTFFVLYNKES